MSILPTSLARPWTNPGLICSSSTIPRRCARTREVSVSANDGNDRFYYDGVRDPLAMPRNCRYSFRLWRLAPSAMLAATDAAERRIWLVMPRTSPPPAGTGRRAGMTSQPTRSTSAIRRDRGNSSISLRCWRSQGRTHHNSCWYLYITTVYICKGRVSGVGCRVSGVGCRVSGARP